MDELVITKELIEKIHTLLDAGLVCGIGSPEPGKMCVEAAICYALGLPHGDEPECVGKAVRAYKIRLNDSDWESDTARAEGLRRLAIAQLGSDKLDQVEFAKRLALGTINTVLPVVFERHCMEDVAAEFRQVTDLKAGRILCRRYAAAAYAAAAADAAKLLSAEMCVQILIDMGSPGAAWLEERTI